MDKRLCLPEVTKFHELIQKMTPVEDLSPKPDYAYRWEVGDGFATLSSRVKVDSPKGNEFFEMIPSRKMIQAIESSMLMSAGYSFYTDVIVRGSTSLVVVKYDQILGSRHIAVVESRTVGISESEYYGVEALVLDLKDRNIRVHRGTRQQMLTKWRSLSLPEQKKLRDNYSYYKSNGFSLSKMAHEAMNFDMIKRVIDS